MPTYPVYDPYPIWWPTKNRIPTIQPTFSVEQIQSQGVWIRWESASRCPCARLNGRHGADPDCEACKGAGWIYHTPQDTQALIQSAEFSPKMLNQMMVYEPGTLFFSARSEHCPTFMDRITVLEGRMRISMLRSRLAERATTPTADALETLPFPIVAKTIVKRSADGDGRGGVDDYTLDVVYLRSVNAGTNVVGAVLTEGVDFTIDYDANGLGQLNWAIGDLKNDGHGHSTSITPNVGDSFTITYYTMPIYRVVDFPHSIRNTMDRAKDAGGHNLSMPVQFKGSLVSDLRELFEE